MTYNNISHSNGEIMYLRKTDGIIFRTTGNMNNLIESPKCHRRQRSYSDPCSVSFYSVQNIHLRKDVYKNLEIEIRKFLADIYKNSVCKIFEQKSLKSSDMCSNIVNVRDYQIEKDKIIKEALKVYGSDSMYYHLIMIISDLLSISRSKLIFSSLMIKYKSNTIAQINIDNSKYFNIIVINVEVKSKKINRSEQSAKKLCIVM